MDKETFVELIEKDLSTRKIGEHLNLSQTTVRYWLKKYKLKTKKELKNRITHCKNCSSKLLANNEKCSNCSSELLARNKKYCSNKCQQEFQNSKIVEDWLAGRIKGSVNGGSCALRASIRNYLIERAGCKCEECGDDRINPHSNNSILTIDHIDGDADNNEIKNLKVLCPSCHAMTPTYGNLGSRNSSRGEYRKEHRTI